MVESISKSVVNYLIERGIILEDEQDIYCYGMDILIGTLLNLVILFMIAVVTNCVWEALVYTLCTSPLRMYGGGYHARTHFLCGALQILSFLIVAFFGILLYSMLPTMVMVIAEAACCLVILIRAPAIHPHSYFPESKKDAAKWKCLSVQLFLMVITLLCIIAGNHLTATLITFSSVSAIITLLIPNKPISAKSW